MPLIDNEIRPMVLVVDDNEVNLDIAGAMLELLGQTFTLCARPLDAQALLRKHQYGLVLLDWLMPELDGVQLTIWLREWELRHGRDPAPVVIISAAAHAEEVAHCLAAGANAHLPKPFVLEDLSRVIGAYLKISE